MAKYPEDMRIILEKLIVFAVASDFFGQAAWR
jgi:hypothetical protein